MRPSRQLRLSDGTPHGMDAYACVPFCIGLYRSESLAVQASMIADMGDDETGGWQRRGFTDPNTREPLTLREMFDRHATCLAVCEEIEQRL